MTAWAGVFALMLGAGAAPAAMITTTPMNFGSDDVQIEVTLDDSSLLGVSFSINVITNATYPNTADLLGFFFNSSADLDEADLASFINITDVALDTTNLGGGNNVNGGSPPLGPFDFGLSIGAPGIGGGDDFQTAGFFVNGTTLADFSGQQFAVRATSTGLPGESREGSSKLTGTFPSAPPSQPDAAIPEPSSIGLMGLGLIALSWAARRRRHRR